MKKNAYIVSPIAFALIIGTGAVHANTPSLIEQLGDKIFHDINLSKDTNQACVSCHDPEAGWTSPDSDINEHGAVFQGSIPGEFGNRKPPSSAYATFSPRFNADFGNRLIGEGNNKKPSNQPRFIGGNFYDGRATGWKLGNPAADQAQGPFLNPVEHALSNPACAVETVCDSTYRGLVNQVWTPMLCNNFEFQLDKLELTKNICEINGMSTFPQSFRKLVSEAYDRIALSIAAFEGSKNSNAFTSKLDAVRATRRGSEDWAGLEEMGHDLFEKHCTSCHTGARGPGDTLPLLTDFSYSNLGVPRNPENPFSIANPKWQDPGLGGFLKTVKGYERYADANMGKMKVPTLRNVALGSCEAAEAAGESAEPGTDCVVKAYMHNGYFKSLKSVVHFYNTRDTFPSCESLGFYDATEDKALEEDCWPKPEVSKNVEPNIMTGLTEQLSEEQEDAIVEFMQTMSDGYSYFD